MPDIAMCQNDSCPSAKKCYRHEAMPWQYQSYSSFYPGKKKKCDSFLKLLKPSTMIDELNAIANMVVLEYDKRAKKK